MVISEYIEFTICTAGVLPGNGGAMIIRNEDIRRVVAEIPEGHRHLRTTVELADGTDLVFQEEAIANIVRAYIRVKTHPLTRRVALQRERLTERKKDYAEWQLLEDE
jgi:hypothetical protein